MSKRIQTQYGVFFDDVTLKGISPKPSVLRERSFLKLVENAFRTTLCLDNVTNGKECITYVVTMGTYVYAVEQDGEHYVFKDVDVFGSNSPVFIHAKDRYRIKAKSFREAATLLTEETIAYSYELRLVE